MMGLVGLVLGFLVWGVRLGIVALSGAGVDARLIGVVRAVSGVRGVVGRFDSGRRTRKGVGSKWKDLWI
jgi:hypothetical protein